MEIFVEQDPPGSNKWNIRMGGKPNANWTGLEPDQVFRTTPFHYRRPEMTSDSKGYLIRSTGLTCKFCMSDDVLQFQSTVWNHLIEDPTDSSKVINVIENHSRFTADLKTMKKAADIFYNKFDKHDLSNDAAAKAFLLDSLEDKFVTIVIRKVKEEDSFAKD